MRRLVATLLGMLMLVGSLVPQNDLGELAKLPELLRHYRYHHSAAGGSLSLGEFLAEHYGAGEPAHTGFTFSDWHRQAHHDLPLRCHHGCTWVGFVVAAPLHIGLMPPTGGVVRAYRVVPPVACCLGEGAGLLQPPRA